MAGEEMRMSATTIVEKPDAGATGEPPEQRSATRQLLQSVFERYSGIVVWAGIIVLFGIIEPSTFLTSTTLRSLLSQQAITAIMALALLLPLAAGVYDLSVAGMMGLAIMLVAWFQATAHTGFALAIVLTLLAGVMVGCFNAFVVVGLGVDSFIATLGMSSILLGLVEWISNGNQIVEGISPSFLNVADKQIFSIQLPFFYMLILAAVLWYVLEYRQVGRYMFATGSNPEAARLAGVRTDRLRALSLVVSAVVASIAGIIFVAQIGSASPDSSTSYLLPAFAGALLGATQIKPGRVNVPGTLLAVYLLATGIQGLELAGAQLWVQDVFNGAALVIAVAFAVRAARRRRN
jgi:ribose transport system permease protein